MGDNRDNLAAPKKPENKTFFSGIKEKWSKQKPALVKDSAKNYTDRLIELDPELDALIISKTRDVEKEPNRPINFQLLTELKHQQVLLHQILESVARCSDLYEKEGKN